MVCCGVGERIKGVSVVDCELEGWVWWVEEGIEEVKWMNHDEVSKMETYASITGVLEEYYNS